jgi:hypothetical protein
MIDGSAKHSLEGKIPFKKFGNNYKIIPNLIQAQAKARVIGANSEKQFYGVDLGIGAKIIFGIDLKLKIGISK